MELTFESVITFRRINRFIGSLVKLTSKNFTIYFTEYLSVVEDKIYILISEKNEYTQNTYSEVIGMNNIKEVIPIVENYVQRGFILSNKDYKKYI
jgi:hypothetical protein